MVAVGWTSVQPPAAWLLAAAGGGVAELAAVLEAALEEEGGVAGVDCKPGNDTHVLSRVNMREHTEKGVNLLCLFWLPLGQCMVERHVRGNQRKLTLVLAES